MPYVVPFLVVVKSIAAPDDPTPVNRIGAASAVDFPNDVCHWARNWPTLSTVSVCSTLLKLLRDGLKPQTGQFTGPLWLNRDDVADCNALCKPFNAPEQPASKASATKDAKTKGFTHARLRYGPAASWKL